MSCPAVRASTRRGQLSPGQYTERMMHWHSGNERAFTWRSADDPFVVLIAEVMLQRTQASQVEHVIVPFLDTCPTPESVLAQDPGILQYLLRGLGLETRSRKIVELCQVLVERHEGKIPGDLKSLLALPGVGPYTANAVRCFAFGEDAAVVDENVVRVLTRIFGVETKSSRPRNDPSLWEFASSLIPEGESRKYQFALLDFAAMVCTPRTKHQGCPFIDSCYQVLQEQNEASQPLVNAA